MNNKNDSGKKKDLSDEYISRLMKTISGAVSESGLEPYRDERRERYTYVKKERPEYFLRPAEEKISYEAEELEEAGVKESMRKDPPRSYRVGSRRTQDLSDINVYSLESMKLSPVPVQGRYVAEEADHYSAGEEKALTETDSAAGETAVVPEEAEMASAEYAADAVPKEAQEEAAPCETAEETAEEAKQPEDGEEASEETEQAEAGEEVFVEAKQAEGGEEAFGEKAPEENAADVPAEVPPLEVMGEVSEEVLPEEESEGLQTEAEEASVLPEEEPAEEASGPDEEVPAEEMIPSRDETTAQEPPEEDLYHETDLRAEFMPETEESPQEADAPEAVTEESTAPEESTAFEETAAPEAEEENIHRALEETDSGDVFLDDDTVLGDEFFGEDDGTGEEDPAAGQQEEPEMAPPEEQPGTEEQPEAEGEMPAETAEEPRPEDTAEVSGEECEPSSPEEVSGVPDESRDESVESEEHSAANPSFEAPEEDAGAYDNDETDREDLTERQHSTETIKEEEDPEAQLPEGGASADDSGRPGETGSAPGTTHLASPVKKKNGKIRRAPVGRRSWAAGGYVPLLGVFMSLGILFMDMLMRCVLDIQKDPSRIMDVSTLYTMLFAFTAGFLMDLIASVPKSVKARRILSNILLAVPTALYLLEFFLKQTYGNYMSVRVIMGNATAVAGSYSGVIWQVIFRGIPMIILFCLPIILMNVLFTKLDKPAGKRAVLIKAVCAAAALALGIGAVMSSATGAVTDREYFTSRFNIDKSITRFGLPMSLTLDCIYMVGGIPQAKESTYPVYVPAMAVEGYVNMVDIDFDAITASHDYWPIPQMDEYFSSLAPTMKNEYTGMFEGKNLVFIVAEAFTGYVIDPELTPTLYKMANEGFVFRNYYQPSWFVSTSDGEYNLLTGLIPDFSIQSMLHTRDKNMYYTPGNVFRRLGYTTMAFHNHDYDYYDRDLTHEHLGYGFWMGMGNGMEEYVEEIWPESDEEMFRGTAHYLTECDGPFHVYYLTVSGHTEYNFEGNYMAKKNRDYVDGTGLSEQVWAIKAQNLELERGLAYLMQELEAAGKLDDTVFVMSCDHYPYGMPDWAYNELAGKELDTVFERYHNTLFVYCSSMKEPVAVDKYCYGPDVIPTVYNLFGIEYDSRLFSGRDILSDSDGLVIFNNYSWITSKGRYNANSGVFYPAEGAEIPDGYADTVSRVVADRIKYAKYILNYDYYDLVFGQ